MAIGPIVCRVARETAVLFMHSLWDPFILIVRDPAGATAPLV
jgi:hypothetical protein